MKIRLAIIAMHPVQYHAPLYKRVCGSPAFNARVLYLDKIGLEGRYDREFRTTIEWDIPLLEGQAYEFLRNRPLNKQGGFFSRINLGIPAALKRGRYDAVFIQGYSLASCWIALMAARRLGIKVLWRGEVVLKASDDSKGLRSRLRGSLIKFFLKRCDALMYTCAGNREFLLRYAPRAIPPHPLVCAVDNDYFRREYHRHLPDSLAIRDELGIPSGNIVLLFCGRLTSWKRPLDALLAVKKAGTCGISVLIVGDGPMREELLAFKDMHAVHVVHVGFVNQSEISRYFTITDILCLPSERDNSPKALNEAMNFNLVPIVSSAVGTCGDLIVDGETGFRCAPGDTDAMATYISLLREQPALRHRMAASAREHIARYTYAANVDGLEAAALQALEDTKGVWRLRDAG
ncbi:MAG: glycosyltransferase family 4 protein [Arenimonas sp.]|uniref:glycosyltransferase family 4 protein n=1 Tax=Arenimonas sp. TaxID=1872635 RepID=UPI0025C298B9|nr:glycosyltransferase family 4 protein [Arenimonas sp.]MBW8368916.1 glycosyltransferase family 4 protein [Arenimonas sp.]